MQISKWISRSGQIAIGTIKESGSDYTANLSQFMSDAKQLRDTTMKVAHNTKDTFAQMKSSGGIGKRFEDWFFGKGQQFGDADLNAGDDDEFDAGFHGFDESNKETEGSSSGPSVSTLNASDMKHIARGQVGAMYGMFGQLTQANMANTAEIVSTLNNRSSETTAALNNISSILTTMSKKMDSLIAVNQENQMRTENGLFNSDGKIDISTFGKAMGDALKEHPAFSMFTMMKDMKGMLTPEMLLSQAVDMSGVKDKKLGILGGQSIDEFGKKINEAVGNSINDVLTGLINNDFFKSIFGDLNESKVSKDYSVGNSYNTKPAQFDGMARWSIVSIIPEHLRGIREALTGQSFVIDPQSGKLLPKGQMKDQFHSVGAAALGSNGMVNNDQLKDIKSNSKSGITDNRNIKDGMAALNAAFVIWLHDTVGLQTLPKEHLHSNNQPIISAATDLMVARTGIPKNKCRKLIIEILMRLENPDNRSEAQQFMSSVKRNLEDLRKEATERGYVTTDGSAAKYSGGLGGLIKENFVGSKEIETQRKKALKEIADAEKKAKGKGNLIDRVTGKAEEKQAAAQKELEELKKRHADLLNPKITKKEKDMKPALTQLDYLRGIFSVLNRGINVKVQNIDKQGKLIQDKNSSYKQYPLKHRGSKDEDTVDSFDVDSSASSSGESQGGFIGQMKSIFVDPIKNAFSGLIPEPLKKIFGDVKDKAVDKFRESKMGQKVLGPQDGSKPGLLGAIGNKIKVVGGQVFNEAKDTIANVSDNFNGYGKKHESSNIKKIQEANKTKSFEGKDLSIRDQALVQSIVGKAQAAISSTDGAADDWGDVMSDIDKIEDKEMARHMQKTIGGMMRRNVKKDEKKGILGKIIAGLGIALKSVFGMITKVIFKAVMFIGRAFSKVMAPIKKLMGGLFNFFKNMAKSAWKDFKGGAKDISQGFKKIASRVIYGEQKFDKDRLHSDYKKLKADDPNFKVSNMNADNYRYSEGGLINNVRNLKDKAKDKVKPVVDDWKDKLTKGIKFVFDPKEGILVKGIKLAFQGKDGKGGLLGIFSKVGGWASNLFKGKGIGDKKDGSGRNLLGKAGDKLKSFGSGIKEKFSKTKVGEFASGVKEGFTDSIKQTDGVQQVKEKGFLASIGDLFKDPEAEAKKKEAEEAKKQREEELKRQEDVAEAITSETPKGIFAPLIDLIERIADPEGHEEKRKKREEEEAKRKAEEEEARKKQLEDADQKKKADDQANKSMQDKANEQKAAGKQQMKDGFGKAKEALSGGEGIKGIGKAVGQIAGGIAKMGIAMIKIELIMAAAQVVMEGIQVIMDAVKQVLIDGLKPIGKIFTVLLKEIKPILKILTDIIKLVATSVAKIITTIMKVLTPILSVVSDILGDIFEVIGPILKIVTDLLNAVMIPIMIVLENVVVPILRTVGNSLQFIMGILQVGFGILQVALGGILTAIGFVVEVLTLGMVSSMRKSGVQMVKDGATMVVDGGKTMVEAVVNQVQLMKDMFTLSVPEEAPEYGIAHDPENTKRTISDVGMTGSGDTYNTYNNTYNTYRDSNNTNSTSSADIYNTYGAGDEMNQKAFGNYLNMKDRGCGPAVLADAYNRRLYGSGPVNAAQVATGMYRSGTYEPGRGTSVANMINTGNAMGMGLRPGGVTSKSLSYASPRNPVTVIGSGSGYGTRRGNQHYVNVVGTQGNSAYVSNPLTGRTSRQPIGSIVGGARMGLYGSGNFGIPGGLGMYGGAGEDDNEFNLFKFDEKTTTSFRELKETAGNLLKMFSMDKSTDEEISDQRKKAEAKEQARNAELLLSQYKDLSREQRTAVDELAIYLFWTDELNEPDKDKIDKNIRGLNSLLGIWNDPSECNSQTSTYEDGTPVNTTDNYHEPNEEIFRIAIDKIFNTKKKKTKYDDVKHINYLAEIIKYRKKFIDVPRTIQNNLKSANIPINLDVCPNPTVKVKKLVDDCSCEVCTVRKKIFWSDNRAGVTPRQAWKDIPNVPAENRESVQKIYMGKAMGLFLAEERKAASDRDNLLSRLKQTDMEDQDESNVSSAIRCPKCGWKLGSKRGCEFCDEFNKDKEAEEQRLQYGDDQNNFNDSGGPGGAGKGVLALERGKAKRPDFTMNKDTYTDHPLHDFFKNYGPGPDKSSSFYYRRKVPDQYGEGTVISDFQKHKGYDPVSNPNAWDKHMGIDFVGSRKLIATTDGIVTDIGNSHPPGKNMHNGGTGYGNFIKWRDGKDGTGPAEHLYGHLDEIGETYVDTSGMGPHQMPEKLKKGSRIIGGKTWIGTMGDTGHSDGTHLHYDVIINGQRTNPMKYFKYFIDDEQNDSDYFDNPSDDTGGNTDPGDTGLPQAPSYGGCGSCHPLGPYEVIVDSLNIRPDASTNKSAVGTYTKGNIVTVTQTAVGSDSNGGSHWGQTNKGWIALGHCRFVGSTGSSSGNLTGSDNKEKSKNFLRSIFPDVQAAAVLGSFGPESSFNPLAINPNDQNNEKDDINWSVKTPYNWIKSGGNSVYGNTVTGRDSIGLQQWNASRSKNLINKYPGSYGDLDGQLTFMKDEAPGQFSVGRDYKPNITGWSGMTNKQRYDTWMTLTDPGEAGRVYRSSVVRPQNSSSSRQWSIDMYNSFGSGDVSIPDYEIPQIMTGSMNQQADVNQPQMIRIDGAVVELKLEQLERILRNKFLVEDEKTHHLLGILIKRIEEKQKVTPIQSQQSISLDDLFNEEIPAEYTRILT